MFEGLHLPQINVAEHVAHRCYIHIILYWNSRDDLLSEWLEILHKATNDLKVSERATMGGKSHQGASELPRSELFCCEQAAFRLLLASSYKFSYTEGS
jgi:hypothetical protein